MKGRIHIILLMKHILLAIVLLTGCRPSDTYHHFKHLPQEGWNKKDTIVFTLPQQKDNSSGNVNIEIRHSGKYPYQSIWLIIAHNEIDSCIFQTDTIECNLIDSKGHFDGNGINDLYQKSFPCSFVSLRKNTAPTFKISHYMKDKNLPGITDIGIRISSAQHRSE